MSEPLHNRTVTRDKLAAALKRNMARRKEVANIQLPAFRDSSSAAGHFAMRSRDGRGEPEHTRVNEVSGSAGDTPPAPKVQS